VEDKIVICIVSIKREREREREKKKKEGMRTAVSLKREK
jgi:hypothetical protein